MYVLAQTAGAVPHVWVFSCKGERDQVRELQKMARPLMTTYIGEVGPEGLVVWEKPPFPK